MWGSLWPGTSPNLRLRRYQKGGEHFKLASSQGGWVREPTSRCLGLEWNAQRITCVPLLYNYLHIINSSPGYSLPFQIELNREILVSLVKMIRKKIYPKALHHLWFPQTVLCLCKHHWRIPRLHPKKIILKLDTEVTLWILDFYAIRGRVSLHLSLFFSLPSQDGIIVHHEVAISIWFVSTHLYTWVERGTVREKCYAKEHWAQWPWPGLESTSAWTII